MMLFVLLLLSGCLQQSTVKSAEFDTQVNTVQNSNYDSNLKQITVIVQTDEDDNLIDYRNPIINFTFVIYPPPGSYEDDYAYLIFSAHDYDPRIFRDSDGIYQLIWKDENRDTFLISGEKRLKMLNAPYLELEMKLNPYQLAEIGDSSLQITFHNLDDSWSDTYDVLFLGVEVE